MARFWNERDYKATLAAMRNLDAPLLREEYRTTPNGNVMRFRIIGDVLQCTLFEGK